MQLHLEKCVFFIRHNKLLVFTFQCAFALFLYAYIFIHLHFILTTFFSQRFWKIILKKSRKSEVRFTVGVAALGNPFTIMLFPCSCVGAFFTPALQRNYPKTSLKIISQPQKKVNIKNIILILSSNGFPPLQ